MGEIPNQHLADRIAGRVEAEKPLEVIVAPKLAPHEMQEFQIQPEAAIEDSDVIAIVETNTNTETEEITEEQVAIEETKIVEHAHDTAVKKKNTNLLANFKSLFSKKPKT